MFVPMLQNHSRVECVMLNYLCTTVTTRSVSQVQGLSCDLAMWLYHETISIMKLSLSQIMRNS